jgi:hypothetical protein
VTKWQNMRHIEVGWGVVLFKNWSISSIYKKELMLVISKPTYIYTPSWLIWVIVTLRIVY